jgi:hypothetical protein
MTLGQNLARAPYVFQDLIDNDGIESVCREAEGVSVHQSVGAAPGIDVDDNEGIALGKPPFFFAQLCPGAPNLKDHSDDVCLAQFALDCPVHHDARKRVPPLAGHATQQRFRLSEQGFEPVPPERKATGIGSRRSGLVTTLLFALSVHQT